MHGRPQGRTRRGLYVCAGRGRGAHPTLRRCGICSALDTGVPRPLPARGGGHRLRLSAWLGVAGRRLGLGLLVWLWLGRWGALRLAPLGRVLEAHAVDCPAAVRQRRGTRPATGAQVEDEEAACTHMHTHTVSEASQGNETRLPPHLWWSPPPAWRRRSGSPYWRRGQARSAISPCWTQGVSR